MELSTPLAASNPRRLLTWGDGLFAAHGHDTYDAVPFPRQVVGVPEIAQVACGWANTLALTTEGVVLDWGWPYQLKQILGLSNAHSHLPGVISSVQENVPLGRLAMDLADKVPKVLEGLQGIRVVQVDAGAAFGAALSQEGHVFTWGDPSHSQLGRGYDPGIHDPMIVQDLADAGVKITKIRCGFGHLMMIDEKGEVWGSGKLQGLGLGIGRLEDYPKNRVSEYYYEPGGFPINVASIYRIAHPGKDWIGKVVDLACGINCTAFLTDDGKLYTCGRGASGVLGHANFDDVYFPKHLDVFDGEKIVHVAAKYHHMVAITESGRVFTWGLGNDGQCGRLRFESVGSSVADLSNTFDSSISRLIVFKPGEIQVLPKDFKPVSAALSFHQTALLSQDGRCIFFGVHKNSRNRNEEFLLNANYSQISPAVPIESASLGWSHYALISSPTSLQTNSSSKTSRSPKQIPSR